MLKQRAALFAALCVLVLMFGASLVHGNLRPTVFLPSTPNGMMRKLLQATGNTSGLAPPASFQPTAIPLPAAWSGLQVAVLASAQPGYAEDVVTKLRALNLFGNVTLINATAPVTLDMLTGLDAVLVFADTCFADPVALGDLLAQYVESGGGVVLSGQVFGTAGDGNTGPSPCLSLGGALRGPINATCQVEPDCDTFTASWIPVGATPVPVIPASAGDTFVPVRSSHWLYNSVVSFSMSGSYLNISRLTCNETTTDEVGCMPCDSDDLLISLWSNGTPLVVESPINAANNSNSTGYLISDV